MKFENWPEPKLRSKNVRTVDPPLLGGWMKNNGNDKVISGKALRYGLGKFDINSLFNQR